MRDELTMPDSNSYISPVGRWSPPVAAVVGTGGESITKLRNRIWDDLPQGGTAFLGTKPLNSGNKSVSTTAVPPLRPFSPTSPTFFHDSFQNRHRTEACSFSRDNASMNGLATDVKRGFVT
ncbi:hypothetical protein E3N88_18079 [Mikania micrantha]|uniref:Uncharacterized protein n=1 Tax=Mikania micrantha TaxID=192012 RepID=A0A5N6NVG1_9ASTR|nr:hypothetical protein E3N88_18079 [Mikania micrantha]